MLPHDVVLLHCTYNQNKPCPRTSVKIAQRFWFWNQGGSRDPRARTRNREREGAVHTGGGTLASLATRDVAMPAVCCNFSIFILETAIWHDAPSLKARRCWFPACRCRVAEKNMQKKSQSSCYRSLCCDSTSRTPYWDTLMLNALLRVCWDSMDWKWTAQIIKEILLTGLALLTCTCIKTSLLKCKYQFKDNLLPTISAQWTLNTNSWAAASWLSLEEIIP